MHIWPAVTVPFFLYATVHLVWKRANPGAKLAAIWGGLFAGWALLAVTYTSVALALAGWLADGIIGDTHALGVLGGLILLR